MMYNTTVTIVIVSPNIKDSEWIDWEIEYCLKEFSRQSRTSHTNGVVGIIMKIHGNYEWLKTLNEKDDGCSVSTYDDSKLYNIINSNRYNQDPKVYSCDVCKCVDMLTGSYISLIEEDDFLANPTKFIDDAFKKSENSDGYKLLKIR